MLRVLVAVISLASVSAYSTCDKVAVAVEGYQLHIAGMFAQDPWSKNFYGKSVLYDVGFSDHRLAYEAKTEGRTNLRGTQAGDGTEGSSLEIKASGRCEGREGTWHLSAIDSEGNERWISVDDCAEHPVDITSDKWMASYPGCKTCPAQYIETPVVITCAQDEELGLLEQSDQLDIVRLLDTAEDDYSFSFSYDSMDYSFSFSYDSMDYSFSFSHNGAVFDIFSYDYVYSDDEELSM